MGFGGGGGTSKVKSDINVTPLVDVVLVLLIIFIVAIPVMLHQITLDVPKKAEEEEIPDPEIAKDQIIVQMKNDGTILMQSGFGQPEAVPRTELAKKLHDALEPLRENKRIVFVDFEDNVPYGEAVSVMDTVKGAKASTIGLKMKDQPAIPAQ